MAGAIGACWASFEIRCHTKKTEQAYQMKTILTLLLLTTATLHAQTSVGDVLSPTQTRDTSIQWRYDSLKNTQYSFVVDSIRYVVPARDSFLYIGKDVPNSDSVYRAQLWSRAIKLERYINKGIKK
jgi:hypothetical protein